MPSYKRSDPSHPLVHIDYIADDEMSATSSTSPTARSNRSQNPLHCTGMIETLFSTIFGGCCRPGQCPGAYKAGSRRGGKRSAQMVSSLEPQTPRRGQGNGAYGIAQPPQIRRLALDDELVAPELDRSGSLSFLFYQDDSNESDCSKEQTN